MKTLKNCTVTVMVSALEPSLEFYIEKLGLTLKQNYGGHYAEVEAPGLLLGLHPTENPIEGNNMSVGFGVGSLTEAVEELRLKNIECKVEEDGWGSIAHFKDPDGNALFAFEMKI